MADGISATDVGMLLFDVEPKDEIVRTEAALGAARPAVAARNSSAARCAASSACSAGRLRWLWKAPRAPARPAKRSSDGIVGLWEVGWNLTRPAPKVAFNCDIGPSRSFTWTSGPLDDFKLIKNALGGTVNDVTLAVAGGALRRWLEDRDVDVDELELQALVPVSVRTENEHGELGNRLTAMRGPLPVHIADPVERLSFVTGEMEALKASKQALGAEAIWGLNDWFREFAPPLLLNPTATINFSTPALQHAGHQFPRPAGAVLRPRA